MTSPLNTTIQTFQCYENRVNSALIDLEKQRNDSNNDANVIKEIDLWISFWAENQLALNEALPIEEIGKIQSIAIRMKVLSEEHANYTLYTMSQKLNNLFQETNLAKVPENSLASDSPTQLMDLPHDTLMLIFNEATSFNDILLLGQLSKKAYSIVHNPRRWSETKVFKALKSFSGAKNLRAQFLMLLKHMGNPNAQNIDGGSEFVLDNAKKLQFAKDLAKLFFNEASDQVLLLFLKELNQKDKEFFLSLLNDAQLHRSSLSLCGYKDLNSPTLGLTWFLNKMPNIEALDLSFNVELTDKDLHQIAKLPNLETLNLNNCTRLTGAEINKLVLDEAQKTTPLANSLKVLKMAACNNLDTTFLKDLKQFSNLQTLDLHNSKKLIDSHLAFLQHTHSIKDLNLSNCSAITDEALTHLGFTNETLTNLDLSNTKINGSGLKHLDNSSSLSSLNLQDCSKLADSGFRGMRLPRLKHLNINRSYQLNGECFSEIRTWEQLQTLSCQKLINLTNEQLKNLTSHPNINTLDVSFCSQIDTEGLGPLISTLDNLEKLQLTNCPRIDGHLLHYLATTSKLHELNLAYCLEVKGTPFLALAELPQLRVLKLNGCLIDKEDMAHLGKAEQLEHLDVSDCPNLDDGALVILPPRLTALLIRNNESITEAALSLFQKLPLNFLDVSYSPHLTASDLKSMIAANPVLKVQFQIHGEYINLSNK